MTGEDTAMAASVVLAAYNAERTLADQLDALAPQLAGGVEVLVCDNGSDDDTRRIAERYAAKGMPLRVVDASARRGPAAARNIGAAHARGALLLFCDADDVVADGWLETMIGTLATADLVAGRLDGRALNTANRASVSWEVSADIRMPFWTRLGAGASSNLGVRKAAFDAVAGFDERLRTGEDVDLCWRVQLAGFTFARSRRAVVLSRQRDGRRAVFRQAYAYGAGNRALRIKYRLHIEADRGRPPQGRGRETPPGRHPEGPPAVRGPGIRLARVLRPFTRTGQANLAWRIGEALGRRFGHVDPRIAPLPPDR